MENSKIIAYYMDQVAFYTKRMKRAEKNIKDIESMGLEASEIHHIIFNDEKENVERYQAKLDKAMKKK